MTTSEPIAVTERACAPESPPPGEGLDTAIWSAAGCTRFAAGIVAVNWVEETKLVESATLLSMTLEVERKFAPVTAMVVLGAPAAITDGEIELTLGIGFGVVP